MKLIVLRENYPAVGLFKALLRTEMSDEEKAKAGATLISLSRAKGGCMFAIVNLQEHDGHAPPWQMNGGNAPLGSSDPTATATSYIERVAADIKAAGLVIEEMVAQETTVEPEYGIMVTPVDDVAKQSQKGEKGKTNWGTYGVGEGEEEEEDEE